MAYSSVALTEFGTKIPQYAGLTPLMLFTVYPVLQQIHDRDVSEMREITLSLSERVVDSNTKIRRHPTTCSPPSEKAMFFRLGLKQMTLEKAIESAGL